jgi:hypothetical protein
MDHLIKEAIRVDLHPNNMNREAGLVSVRSWNLSRTPFLRAQGHPTMVMMPSVLHASFSPC